MCFSSFLSIGPDLQQVYGLTDEELAKLQKDARRVKNRQHDDDDDDIDDKEQVDDDDDDDDDEEASSSSSTSIDGEITGPGGDDDDDNDSDVSSNVGRGEALDAPTRRLAVLKCDWDRLTAVDLLYVLRSYTPPGGTVHNVTIYPSDFGIERMNEEELRAPDVFAAVDDEARAEIDQVKSDKSGFDLEERVEAPRDDAPALNDTAATRAAASAGKHIVQDDADEERHAEANVGDEEENEHFDENDSDGESGNSGEFEFEEENDDISDSVDTDASDDSSDLAMKELFEGAVARQRAGGSAADEEGTFDGAKLRRYQRDRLKYFYAIAECDSPATAAVVKRECQNIELEATANVLEMRYVPDDMKFDDREPREAASAVPALYKPARWYTPAVSHTSVTLTWDESDRNRTALTTRQWTLQDLVNEEQFAHLLPDSEDGSEFSSAGDLGALLKAGNNGDDDDDDDEESSEVSSATRASRLKELRSKARKARIRKRYAALLDGGSGEGGKADGDSSSSSSSDGEEMEITFQSGLSEKTSALLESRDDAKVKAERTWWEVQQEKQQALKSVRHRAKQEAQAKGMNDEEMRAYIVAEVQNAKKDAAAVNKRDPFESFEQGFEGAPQDFADDEEDREAQPKLSRREARKEARKRERKERRKERKQTAADDEAQQRARDELALVMMPSEAEERGGGGGGDEGFSVAGLLAADNKKLKTGRKARDTDHGPVSKYEFDVADKRFAAVLENPAFAIDPNASQFIDTSGMRDVMSKRAERQAELRDRDAAERQKRRETNKRLRGTGGGAAEAAEASTAASTAPSAAAVNMLIAGIKQRSLGADRLKRPQNDRGNAATTEDDGRPKRPRLLQNKRAQQK
jgi:hypothetical protein